MGGDNQEMIYEVPIPELDNGDGFIHTGIDVASLEDPEVLPQPGKISPTGTLRVVREDRDGKVIRAALRKDLSRISFTGKDKSVYIKPKSYILVSDKFQCVTYYFSEDRKIYLMTQTIWGDASTEEVRNHLKLMGF